MSHEETFMNCAKYHRFYPLKRLRTKHFLKKIFTASSAIHYPQISVGCIVAPKNWVAPPL